MKSLLLLVYCFICIGISSADNAGNCKINGITNEQWTTLYLLQTDDSYIEATILEEAYDDTLEVVSCTGANMDLFDINSNNTHFFVKTTAAFADLDKNTPKQENNFLLLQATCQIKCSGTTDSSLIIQFQIEDTNNHAPEFGQTAYEYKVASPIMPSTDFTVYGSKIIVTDLDFSNQDVTFTISPDDFTITTLSSSTSKEYTATFSAKSVFVLTESRTYNLIATDSGTPTRSKTVELTINLDENTSIDMPSFSSSLYTFDYTVEGDKPILTLTSDPITVVTNKAADATIVLNGELKEYFSYSALSDTNVIEVTIKDQVLPPTKDSFTTLTLSVSTDNTASAVLIINRPVTEAEVPQFNSHSYTGSYDDVSNTVTLDDEIKINSTTLPNITLTGDYENHFTVIRDSAGGSYKISVDQELSVSEIKAKSYLSLTLKAAVGEKSDSAALILSLPNHELQFNKVLYSGSYDDGKVTLGDSNSIIFTTEVTSVTISVDDTYSSYFKVIYDDDKKQCVINVLTPLPSNILKNKKEIIVMLTAIDGYENIAHAVVSISLPTIDIEDAPSFSNIYYEAVYSSADKTATLQEDIELINISDQSSINISLATNTEHFAVKYDTSALQWQIVVNTPLPEEILTSKNELIIKMTAKADNNGNEGEAVLVITWSNTTEIKEAPNFLLAYYLVEYPTSGTGTIEFGNPLNFTNVIDPTTITISLDTNNDNFEVQYDESAKIWKILINSPLSEDVLNSKNELVVSMIAKEENNINVGQSALVITWSLNDKTDPPKFSNAYYIAKYPESGSGELELDVPLKVTNIKDPTKVTISLDSNSDNFDVHYDTTSKNWKILIETPLTDDILNSMNELVITMTAKEENKTNVGQSALVITWSLSDTANSPKFSNAYYIAEYPQSGSGELDLEAPLTITNVADLTKVTITLSTNSDNFNIQYNSLTKNWTITIKTPLSDDVLNSKNELVVTMIATEENNINVGKSALVITWSQSDTANAPKFSNVYYIAKYPESGSGELDMDIPVELTNVKDPTKVKISLETNSDNFEIQYNSSSMKWGIFIKAPLSDNILNSENELVIKMTAEEENNANLGHSTLVITWSLSDTDSPLKFSNAFYIAKYPESGSGELDVESSLELTNVEDPTKVTITLETNFDNFNIYYDTSSKNWKVAVKSPLSDDVLNSKNELVIAMSAKEENNTNVGQSALVITWLRNSTDPPKFSNAYYIAKYPKSGSGELDLESPLMLTNVEDPTTVTITLDTNSDNFNIQYDTTSKTWKISIKTPLTDDILNSKNELVITMSAKEANNINVGQSALLVTWSLSDKTDPPKFSNAYYIAKYPESGSGELDLENPLILTNVEDPSTVTITLDSEEYSSYFKIILVSENYIVNVTKPLPDDILNDEVSIVLTIEAELEGRKGYATLIINLPITLSEEPAIAFNKVLYNGKYVAKSKSLQIEEIIQYTTDAVDENITTSISSPGDFQQYFIISHLNKFVTIKLKTSLPDDVINNNSFLPLTLSVGIRGTTERSLAVLNVEIQADSDGKNDDDDDHIGNKTTYIVIISILAVTSILGLIAAIGIFYYFKIRNGKYSQMEEEQGYNEKNQVRFDKNALKTPSDINTNSTLEQRRPTGFIFNPLPEDSVDGNLESSTDFEKRRKSVAFDDHVEKMPIEGVSDEENGSENTHV